MNQKMDIDDKLNGMCKEKGNGSYYSELFDEMYSKMDAVEKTKIDKIIEELDCLFESDNNE